MPRKMRLLAMALLASILFVPSTGFATSCENPAEKLISNIQSYVFHDYLEDMLKFPNATIPYRGSSTVETLNNSIFCNKMDWGYGIEGFIQVNNVFPVAWSAEFFIGMKDDALMEVFQGWNYPSDVLVVEHTEEGEVQIIICSFYGESVGQDSFEVRFSMYDDQVFQIEFKFI